MKEEILERFKSLPLGNICDANQKRGNMDPGIKPIDPGSKLAGEAYTVRCHPRDNLAIHKGIYEAPEGSVLVVDTQGYWNCGYFGDIMALACQVRRIAGLVIDGGCRDADDMQEVGFPVFCRTLNPGGTVKATSGQTACVVLCGGVPVETGDLIVGDRNGVVVVKKEDVEKVLEGAEAIAAKEIIVRERLLARESTLEIYGLDKLL
ncbi:MAG TPA: RraA family protein [Anaerovoracaceae bacterium]|nr:RraA family protein [Anaerovoracaceae bacterium]